MSENMPEHDEKRVLVQVKDLDKVFKVRLGSLGRYKSIHALKNINLTVYKGESVGIVGESGSGKTTLARILMHLYKASAGDVFVCGRNLASLSDRQWKEHCRSIQLVFQDPSWSMNPMLTIEDIVEEPLISNTKQTRKEREQVVEDLLDQVGLPKEALLKYPYELSGGQKQRVGIARAISLKPEVLILDEPTSALDVSVQAQILNLLKDLQEEYNLTYLFISHDLSVVRYMCDRIIVMYAGEIVETGPSDQIFEHPTHSYTETLINAIPKIELI